jgi:hypothetical protein
MTGTQFRPMKIAVLIPTRGRSEILKKNLAKMPWLINQDTFIGVEHDEFTAEGYRWLQGLNVRIVLYDNKGGSVGIARERLRLAATRLQYDYYVATDDNARFNEHAVNALVQSCEAWRVKTGKLTLASGMHPTAAHFDRNLVAQKQTVGGWTTYPGIGFIFHCMPHAWYARYTYPGGCFALEDRHMMLSAIDAGHTEFRVCMDAPYSKSRYQPGGQGDIKKRQWNCGRSIEQLAHDFPLYVGARGTFPLPWKFILQLKAGAKVDRLMGGAMRKGDALTQTTGKLRARVTRR